MGFANLRQWHQWLFQCLDMFWYLQGACALQDSFLCMVLRLSNLFDFQWHQYVSWRSPFVQFQHGPFGHYDHCGHRLHSLLRKPRSTNTGSSVAMTRTWLDIFEHDSEILNMNRVNKGCKTYHQQQPMVFCGFFHVVFRWWPCSSSWSALVPPASEEVPGATGYRCLSSL